MCACGRGSRSGANARLRLLDSKTINRGYFNRKALEELMTDSVSSGHYSKELFSLATLELWHRAFLDNPGAGHKDLAGFLVGDEVQIALAVAQFHVRKTVPLLRQR